jgi:hypothetical protein
VNQDGRFDISDAIFVFDYLFRGAEEIRCLDAADANDDGSKAPDISDGIYLIDWQLLGTEPPPAPGSECGTDPPDLDDFMDCSVFKGC